MVMNVIAASLMAADSSVVSFKVVKDYSSSVIERIFPLQA